MVDPDLLILRLWVRILISSEQDFCPCKWGLVCQLGIYSLFDDRRTVDDSKAAIRSIGSGSRTIEVTYHQYGTASSMSSGNARVVTSRRVVEGLTFAVSSADVGLRGLPTTTALAEPVLDVDMSTVESRVVMQKPKVSHE